MSAGLTVQAADDQSACKDRCKSACACAYAHNRLKAMLVISHKLSWGRDKADGPLVVQLSSVNGAPRPSILPHPNSHAATPFSIACHQLLCVLFEAGMYGKHVLQQHACLARTRLKMDLACHAEAEMCRQASRHELFTKDCALTCRNLCAGIQPSCWPLHQAEGSKFLNAMLAREDIV